MVDNAIHVASIVTAAVCPTLERNRKKKDFAKALEEHRASNAADNDFINPPKSDTPAFDWNEMDARDDEIARLQAKLGIR